MGNDNEPKPMKVHELIAKLQAAVEANPAVADYDVEIDGFGGTDEAIGIDVSIEPPRVLVCRK